MGVWFIPSWVILHFMVIVHIQFIVIISGFLLLGIELFILKIHQITYALMC